MEVIKELELLKDSGSLGILLFGRYHCSSSSRHMGILEAFL